MRKLNLQARTPHGVIKYSVLFQSDYAKNLNQYLDCSSFSKLCAIGCKNYGKKWSCPPFSPSYAEVSKNYDHILLCLLTIELEQLEYIKNSYLKIKAANSILKSRVDRTFRAYKNQQTKYISSGSCRLCKPCKCKNDEQCVHSDTMAYSLEALGLNVENITKRYFNKKLLWYKNKTAPQYTCVVAGLLFNNEIDENEIKRLLFNLN